jgi:predicted nucleic acid-binding protein
MTDPRRWVMDTSAYTHLGRAGHIHLVEQLAPGGVVLIPREVHGEIEKGRDGFPDIPAVASVDWAEIAVLTEGEVWTQARVKAQLGGRAAEHLGECAVIACAHHRNMVAILDERAAVAQAQLLGVSTHDTLWIVVEAYRTVLGRDRAVAGRVVDDLIATGMYLPVDSGESLFTWAYEEGLLP